MLYTEGNLRAEDRALRHIAHGKVNSALSQVETKTAHLIERLVQKVDAQASRNFTAEQLLDWVQNHESLQSEHALIKRYTDAFPELDERVAQKRHRILRTAMTRIQEAVAPFEYGRRFAHTTGLHH